VRNIRNEPATSISNRKVGGSTPPLATTLTSSNARQCGSFSGSGLICPTVCPEQLVDLAGDVAPEVRGEVLVAGGHGTVGPAHQAHDGTLTNPEHEQYGGGGVPGIVEPGFSDVRLRQEF
jgi:hypothetical protein